MRLQGKNAVVTGGNSGIGLATARLFKQEGANVAISGRRKEALDAAASEIGEGTLAIQGDMSKVEDIERMFAEASAKFGKVDIVVANAGMGVLIPAEAMTEEQFDQQTNVNFKGVFFTVQKAVPHLNNPASVVLVSSAVHSKGMPNFAAYAATKAAVRSLARGLSVDLQPKGIRVNSLSPGAIETPIFGKLGLSEQQQKEMGEGITSGVLMGRMGNPEEMAKAALFLSTDDSSYMVGADLMADGGFGQI